MSYQVACLVLAAMIGTAASYMCNGTDTSISAPEVTLNELEPRCDYDHESRYPECVSAINQYCSQVTYPSPINTLGASRDSGDSRISVACVESTWKGDVPAGDLMIFDSGCNARNSQDRRCLTAAHKFCMNRYGENSAGIIQGVTDGTLEVHCFESTRIEDVHHDVMRSFDSGCHYLTSHSSECFRAASLFCSEYFFSDGGITQESDTQTITVACYSANYSGDAFIIRNNDFYASLSEAESVCDIEFDIERGQILEESPDVLKYQIYDNRNSTEPLDASFSVSTTLTESSTFTVQNQFSFTFTAQIQFGIPMLFMGSISLSTAFTSTATTTTTMTESRTFSQSSSVTVPVGKMVMKEAIVTVSTLDVPYTATVRTRLGSMRTIEGTWLGTTTSNFKIAQHDISKYY